MLHYLDGFEELAGHRGPIEKTNCMDAGREPHYSIFLPDFWLDRIIKTSYIFGQEAIPALTVFARQLDSTATVLEKELPS